MTKAGRQVGQSLVEVLVASFILGILAIALAGVSTLGTKTAVVSEQRTVAQALANQREEIIKLTPYLDVGYSTGGVPDGIFPASETVTRNNQSFDVKMDFTLVDDPENGCLDAGPCSSSGLTEETADYKKVVISVKYPAADDESKEVKVSTFSVKGQASALLSLVQCDPTDTSGPCGAGQACCDERCLPVCEPGSCPDGYTCASDGCGCEVDTCAWCDTAECFDDFECTATNQQCLEGSCADKCADDTDCPVNEKCAYGMCEEICSNTTECNRDRICQNGVCQKPGCLDNGYCATGYSCIDFHCEPTSCIDASYCPPNHQCLENTCMPISCSAGTCPGSWQCVSGSCQPPQCTVGQSCNNANQTAICVEKKCQPPSCDYHNQCQGDAVCLSGDCVERPSCPPACLAISELACVNGKCVNPNREIEPLVLTTECPAPITFPCLPAVGEITATWVPVDGEIYCEPTITINKCTIGSNSTADWSDTDGDGVQNCGIPGTSPAINACTPPYPIECGSGCSGCPSCPVNESCVEGRCMPDQACPAGYANHPTLAGKCVEEMAVAPPVACASGCPGGSYCAGVECKTAGCRTDDQCAVYGEYLCRNYVCIPRYERDCSYCIPPERTQYCYGYDCTTCGGGAGSACTDPLGAPSTVVWAQHKGTGCRFLTCQYAASVCGDGVVQPGESCDSGPPLVDTNCPGQCGAGGPCQCPVPMCGNGVLEQYEMCDPGPPVQDANCPGMCDPATCNCPTQSPSPLCGNGTINTEAGEQCDPSAVPQGCAPDEACNFDCTCSVTSPSGTPAPVTCGDGNIDAGEQCDYSALPTGCAPTESCTAFCQCAAPTPPP